MCLLFTLCSAPTGYFGTNQTQLSSFGFEIVELNVCNEKLAAGFCSHGGQPQVWCHGSCEQELK